MTPRVAVVWRGDREARRTATPQNNRFHRVFEELAAIGTHAEPAVFDEAFADEVRDQLLTVDGVLVWVDPLHEGKTRAVLNPLLRDVAARGSWVSAHPDISSNAVPGRILCDMQNWCAGRKPPIRNTSATAVTARLRASIRGLLPTWRHADFSRSGCGHAGAIASCNPLSLAR